MQIAPSIVSVLWRYKQNEELSQPELEELALWLKKSPKNQELFDDLSNEAKWDREIAALQVKDGNATWNKISRWIAETEKPVRKTGVSWLRYAAASVIILVASAGYLLLHDRKPINQGSVTSQYQRNKDDIQPVTNTPVLTLADGTVISLDSSRKGIIAKQASTTLIKDSGQLILKLSRRKELSAATGYNTLTTPKGGLYQVALPDGSRVWLNAVSTLKFPAAFTDSIRTVEINGEGYFEIAKNNEKPFIVKTAQASIRVLGTRFDVNAYANEASINTTLMEGSVALHAGSKHTVLKPGEVGSVSKDGAISVGRADLQQAVAWKDRLLWFQDATYEQIMRQLSRWYNIEVDFKGPVREKYSGVLPGNIPISNLLSILEKGGHVNFIIEGKRVTLSEN
ncbi:MAG: FecR domain-containing protein [Williamsia sp.]|nr:FecR domain-containing protein [Williamsia sp.]